ncbi:Cobalt-precorrin-2 C20-methyltransferase [Patulibacter medicamentivorans]|uniref:Cobalt-precorrin-2 C20-methyltransferase n=1 Tax=Patulibacter medicamentivorans TaxID=1097667 RepID=H0E506_9ACTN|nr:precorrin-2 C(20)-methyltransferase [Patulibacter medicamentivorans]EHN11235.1 Cobalt-precorrin-2 C20-methyltransferase [Patulibacter medicamentivorans]
MATTAHGTLIGIGVGPGDPDHLTLKALKALAAADRVFVPVTEAAGEVGRAERVVAPHVDPAKVERLGFSMRDASLRQENWDRAGAAIAAIVRAGGTAAFCTLGDPNVYSTFTYMAHTVRGLVPEVAVETVPGITAMQDLASRSDVILTEGNESLTLLPLTAGEEALRTALRTADTVVAYKGGRRMPRVREILAEEGRLEDAVYGELLGVEGQDVSSAEDRGDRRGPYLSTVIVPARRDGERGGKLRDERGQPL